MVPEHNKIKYIGIGLALITFLLFAPACFFDFIGLDDNDYVRDNPYVLNGITLPGIQWAFTHVYANYWLPMVWISFMIDSQIWGVSPFGFHLTNILLHSVNALLFFRFLAKATSQIWVSAFAAAFFAWHPLRVEAVVWITQRKDVLSTFFFLLLLNSYIHYAKEPSWRRYCLLVVFMVLGLMSKTMLVTVPLLLLLIDFWPLRRVPSNIVQDSSLPGMAGQQEAVFTKRPWQKVFLEKIPLMFIAAFFVLTTVLLHPSKDVPMSAGKLTDRMYHASCNYQFYFEKTLLPKELSLPYPSNIPEKSALASTCVLAVITLFSVITYKRWPCFLFGWWWFIIGCFPVIGVIQVGLTRVADRFTYLPSLGLSCIIAWGLLAISGQFRKKRLFQILAVSSLATLLILTRMQIQPWKNGGTLAEHALRLTTNNFMALNMLGRSLEESDRLLEALDYYEQALQINPQYFDARMNRVNAWTKAGRRISAVKELESMHKEYPANARLQSNLGVLLYQQGDKTQGIRHLREAVSKDKSLLDVQFNLSIALYQSGMKEEASTILLDIIQRNPSDFASHLLLGKIFIETKEASKAKKYLAHANRIRPQDQECTELIKQLQNLEYVTPSQ